MPALLDLFRAQFKVIESQRIGQPLFFRYLLQGVLPAEKQGTVAALAEVAALIGETVGKPADTVFTLVSSEKGPEQTTLTLRFANGATALITEVHGQPKAPPGVESMIVGSKGAIYSYYDGAYSFSWEDISSSLSPGHPKLISAIEASRKNGGQLTPIPPLPADGEPPTPPKTDAPRAKKYGVLLVTGSHTHQENYGASFAADPRCQVIAVTDEPNIDKRRRELNERLADTLGVPYMANLAEALKRKDVDIVSICAPPERRARIIVQCAAAGKHLYLDKSLCPRLDEADAIAEAVRKAGVRSHMFSFIPQPWAQEAKQLVRSGKLGTLLAVHADAFFAKGYPGTAKLGAPRQEEYPPQRHQLVEAKREFDNVGVYPITFIRWLTGHQFHTIYGVTGNYFFKEHQRHNVEDFGLLSGRLDNDLPVTIAAGRFGWTTHPAAGVNRVILVGSERTAIVDFNRPRLEVYAHEKPWVPPSIHPEDPMGFWSSTQDEVHTLPKTTWLPFGAAARSDTSYFVDCLDAGQDSDISASAAAHAAEVLLATYRSAATGQVVTLPLPRK